MLSRGSWRTAVPALPRIDGHASRADATWLPCRPPDPPSAPPQQAGDAADAPSTTGAALGIQRCGRTGSRRQADAHAAAPLRPRSEQARQDRRLQPSELSHRAARSLRAHTLAERGGLGNIAEPACPQAPQRLTVALDLAEAGLTVTEQVTHALLEPLPFELRRLL